MSNASKHPDAFRTISEISEELDVPTHVLRFWETKFDQLAPVKRNGRRRYYRPEDRALLERIKGLLYDQGYTIKGVQRLLGQEGDVVLAKPKSAKGIKAKAPKLTPVPAELLPSHIKSHISEARQSIAALISILD